MKLPADLQMKDWQKIIIDKYAKIIKNGGKIILRPRCNGKPMSRHYFLNPDKSYRPCDLMTWANQFELGEGRHVGDDDINDCRVSTIWLGTDYNYWGGPPLLLETMVFKNDSSIYCKRYTTWAEAEAGHQEAIQWVKNGCKDDE